MVVVAGLPLPAEELGLVLVLVGSVGQFADPCLYNIKLYLSTCQAYLLYNLLYERGETFPKD